MSPMDLLPDWDEHLYAEEPLPRKPKRWWDPYLSNLRWFGRQAGSMAKYTAAATAAFTIGVKVMGLGFVPQETYREDQKAYKARIDTLTAQMLAKFAANEVRFAVLEVRVNDHLAYSDTNMKTARLYAKPTGYEP